MLGGLIPTETFKMLFSGAQSLLKGKTSFLLLIVLSPLGLVGPRKKILAGLEKHVLLIHFPTTQLPGINFPGNAALIWRLRIIPFRSQREPLTSPSHASKSGPPT